MPQKIDLLDAGHARKMVARLDQAECSNILYYENIEGGHGTQSLRPLYSKKQNTFLAPSFLSRCCHVGSIHIPYNFLNGVQTMELCEIMGTGGAADNKQTAFMNTLIFDFLWSSIGKDW